MATAYEELIPASYEDLIPRSDRADGSDVSAYEELIPARFELSAQRVPTDSLELGAQNFLGAQRARPLIEAMPAGPGVIEPGPEGLERMARELRRSRPVEALLGPALPPSENSPASDIERRGLISTAAGMPARVATDLGRGLKAGLGDVAAGIEGRSERGKRDALAGGDNFGGNIEAFLKHEEKLPIERAVELSKEEDKEQKILGWQSIAADISLGLADMAPKVAMLEAVPGGLLTKGAAAADIFGFGPEGEFHPRHAAFAAAFPFATAAATKATDAAIAKAVERGFEWAGTPAAQRALHVASNQAAMDALMVVQESPELLELAKNDPDEFKRELAKIVGSNLAFAIPEAFKERGARSGEQGAKTEQEQTEGTEKLDLESLQREMQANQIAPKGTSAEQAAGALKAAEEKATQATVEGKKSAQAEEDALAARVDFEAAAQREKLSEEQRAKIEGAYEDLVPPDESLTEKAGGGLTEPAAAPETITVRTASEELSRNDERKGSGMTAETGAIPARPAATPVKNLPVNVQAKQAEATRPWDIIDEIEGGIGKISLQSARETQEDFKPRGAARKLFGRGGQRVDEILEALRRKGVFPEDATTDELLDALNAAAEARKAWRAGVTTEQKELAAAERRDLEFQEEISKAGSQKTDPIVPEDLNEGDVFTLAGTKLKVTRMEFDDDGRVLSVELEDGKRYGTQQVGADTVLRMDKGSLKRKIEPIEFAPKEENLPPPSSQLEAEKALPDPTVSEVSAEKPAETPKPESVRLIEEAKERLRKSQNVSQENKDKIDQWLDKAIERTNFKRGDTMEGVTGAPVWLTKPLVNGALRVIRASYKAGKKVYQALEDGVRWLKEQNAQGFNEEEARNWLNEYAREAKMFDEPRYEGAAGWEVLRDKLLNVSRRVEDLKAQIEQNEKSGKSVKELKQEKRFAERQYKSLWNALKNNEQRIEDLILRHDQAAKDLRDAREKGRADDIERKKLALENLAAWLEGLPPSRLGEIYRRLVGEGRISSPGSVHEDATWTEAAAAAGEGAPAINSTNPDAVRARPNFGPEPGRPWDESVPGVAWLPAALDGLRLARARLAAWWKGRGTREEMVYSFDSADNRANNFAKKVSNTVLHALNRAFAVPSSEINKRNELREIALSFVVESKGDAAALNEMRERILAGDPRKDDMRKALKAIEFAEAHLDILQPVAELYSRLTEMERGHELNAGLNVPEWKRTGYVYHAQDLDVDAILTSSGARGGKIMSQPHTHVRDFATLAESIAAHIHPRSMNAIDLLQYRIGKGQRAVNQAAWLQNLREMKDPTTEQPLVTDLLVRQRPDGSQDVTAPAGYERVQFGPLDVALLKGYDGIFADLTDQSWVRRHGWKKAFIKAAAVQKSATLLFDTFHLGRLMAWKFMITHDFKFNKGLTLLDNTEGELRLMAERGEIPPGWLDNVLENKRLLDLAMETGFNVGRISDNMHADWLHKLWGIGRFNHWLFQQFQRGAMADAWLMEFERMRKLLPNSGEKYLARRVTKDLNVRFGNLGRQGFFRSQTGQDLARWAFLAPQWNEALIRSELGFVKQLLTAPAESYREGRLVVPTMLKAVGTMLVGQFIANQIINYATRGHPTWENEEEGWGSKLSAWIPDYIGGGPGFFLHPFGIAGEITHLLTKKHERTLDWWEAAKEAGRSRFSLQGQSAATALTRNDPIGRKLRPEEVWGAALKALLPVPISGGSVYSGVKQLVTGEHSEQFPGQFQKQLMASFGVKTDQAPSSEQRIQALAREFKLAKGIKPRAEDYPGDFKELEKAIRLGNKTDQRKALEELLEKKTKQQIVDYWWRWSDGRFTGTLDREEEFKRSLTPIQMEAYRAAVKARQKIRNEALQLLR